MRQQLAAICVQVQLCNGIISRVNNNAIFNQKLHGRQWTNIGNGIFCRQMINTHKCSIWAKHTPHVKHPVLWHSHKVIVLCGNTANSIIGPYFFEEKMTYVNADSLNSTLSRFTIPDTSETWHLNATNFNAGSNIIAY